LPLTTSPSVVTTKSPPTSVRAVPGGTPVQPALGNAGYAGHRVGAASALGVLGVKNISPAADNAAMAAGDRASFIMIPQSQVVLVG
jgi:hypothetical protein